MKHLPYMKAAVKARPAGEYCHTPLLRYRSFRETYGKSPLTAGAMAQKAWFETYPAYIHEYDRIAGSHHGNFITEYDPKELSKARSICGSYGQLGFWTNSDHFAPGYDRFLKDGICGTMARIDESLLVHKNDPDKVEFLTAQKTVLEGFSVFVRRHSEAALDAAARTDNPDCKKELTALAVDLAHAAWEAPVTLRQALNLVWLCHLSFLFQGKYAMALGRMDQYLYSFYKHDIEAGILTPEDAEDLFA